MHKQRFKIGSSVTGFEKQGRLFLMILTQGPKKLLNLLAMAGPTLLA